METTYVGVDIAGTQTRVAIVDTKGRVLSDRQCATPVDDDGAALVEWLVDAVVACRSEVDSPVPPVALGVAVPGVLGPGRAAVTQALDLPVIEGLPLRDTLSKQTGLRVVLDSNAVVAAWGEYCLRERKIDRMVCLTLGTGVGAAVIFGGRILRHSHHSAGHLGHLICDTSADAPKCRCGVPGCLESRVGGPALTTAAVQAGFTDGIASVEIRHQEGDAAATGVIEAAAAYLARGLVNIAHVYPANLLVVGGEVAQALPSLVRKAAALAAEWESALLPQGMRVELAGLGAYSGVVGAALLAAEE